MRVCAHAIAWTCIAYSTGTELINRNMEPNKPKCKTHERKVRAVCLACKELMCFKCLGPHVEKGCKGGVVDLPSYASKSIVPRIEEMLKNLEQKRRKLEEAKKASAGALPEIKRSLRALKENTEKLLGEINKYIEALEGYNPDFAGSHYDTIKVALEQQLNEVKVAVLNDNMGPIIKTIESHKELLQQPNIPAEAADVELRSIEETNSAVARLLATKEFSSLGECLQGAFAMCQNALKQKAVLPEVTSRFVYGVCGPADNYGKLCRYGLVTKKIVQCVPVPQFCSVLQLGKRVFISGGGNDPVVNTLSEYVEEEQKFVSKSSMNYAKISHTMVAISPTQFITIGGFNGSDVIPYCEEYSIPHNVWKLLPPLNKARYCSAATLSADGAYIYVIGGYVSDGIIERLDMMEKKVWEKVALSEAAEVSLSSNSAAFSISADEIMIFVGNNTADCGLFNTKTGTVKKHELKLKPDCYYFNPLCMIGGDAYFLGTEHAHLHIYRSAAKKIEEVDYHNASL